MNEQETIWVCPACGRTADTPYEFSDVSCSMNAILCYKDKLEYRGEDKVLVGEVKDGGVVDPQPNWSEDEEE